MSVGTSLIYMLFEECPSYSPRLLMALLRIFMTEAA
jgi:hypothetical protein